MSDNLPLGFLKDNYIHTMAYDKITLTTATTTTKMVADADVMEEL